MSATTATRATNESQRGHEKQTDVRLSNITAAKALADCVRTSLGPRGMDKMIIEGKGEVIVSNDGATIMKKFDVTHPCAKMLVDLSKAQDIEAGDGTTSVVVLCGSLLRATEDLLQRGIHPTQVSEAFQIAAEHAEKVVRDMSIPVNIEEKEPLVKAAITSLNSKVVSSNSALLAPMAVDAVRTIMKSDGEVDLRDIRVVTALGGTVEDTEFITDGMIFKQKASTSAGGPTKIADANIALIQFQISPPKTDMESTVVVSDYTAIDRAMKEERKYILDMCRTIQQSGCNVLLVQKSILRDAVTALSLDILAKMKIMVVKDIERNDVPFICKALGLLPVANIENLKPEKFAKADLVAQESTNDGRVVRIRGVKTASKEHRTASVFVRGSNQLMVAEAERSFHDALCVVRSIAKKRALIAGGAAAEIEIALKLSHMAREIGSVVGYCMRSYAEAFEIIPYTLAENAGLNPVAIVTELRNAHAMGDKPTFGINVRKGCVTDMEEEGVVQPLLVTTSALRLATECVCMILKIDDIVLTR